MADIYREISVDDMMAFLVSATEEPLVSQFASKIPPAKWVKDESGRAQSDPTSEVFCEYFSNLSALAKIDFSVCEFLCVY